MFIVDEKNGHYYVLPTKEVKNFRLSSLALKILHILSKTSMYPKEMADFMGIHEQKIYYHVRNLERAGLIHVSKQEMKGGSIAKYYSLNKPSVFLRFANFEKVSAIPKPIPDFLQPFIENNKLNAIMVVGSHEPHGPESARSRDAYYAIELALFLGIFLTNAHHSFIKLDTEIHKHDLKKNLIIVGGPITNNVMKKVNDKLPIRFTKKNYIFSSITKKTYTSDNTGMILKTSNPWERKKSIIILAGKRYSGTHASIIGLIKYFREPFKGRLKYKIVKGLDLDADGKIDDVKILE
jgi:DNA-binding transcriptional ArsR family regulator